MELKIFKGLGLQDILTEVHTYVHRSQCATIVVHMYCVYIHVVDFPPEIRMKLLDKLANIE